MKQVEIYSDGSGNTMDGDGGYGYVIVVDGVKVAEGMGFLPNATNNVAEITAAIEGLHKYLGTSSLHAEAEVTLVCDSQLVLKYATGEYKCKAMHLVPLYINLRKLFKEANAKTRWVRGHNGDKFNEECDVLAKTAREQKDQVCSPEGQCETT